MFCLVPSCVDVSHAGTVIMGDFVDEIKAGEGTYKFYVNGEWKASTRCSLHSRRRELQTHAQPIACLHVQSV